MSAELAVGTTIKNSVGVKTATAGTGASATLQEKLNEALTRMGVNTAASTDPSLATGDIFTKLRGLGVDADAILAYVDELETRLTSTRATNLDNLNATVSSRASPSDVDAQVNARLGAATPASPTVGSVYEELDVLLGRLTALRAGYLDNLSGGAVALSSQVDTLEAQLGLTGDTLADASGATGTLHAKMRGVGQQLDTLEGRVTGAVALSSQVDGLEGSLGTTADPASATGTVQARLAELVARLSATRTGYLDNLSAGPVALQSSVDDLEGRLTALRAANLDNIDAAVSTRLAAASYTAPDNAGIAAVKAKTDNLPANPASQTNLDAAVSTRAPASTALSTVTWTGTRAGYLDNLASPPMRKEQTDRIHDYAGVFVISGNGAFGSYTQLTASFGFDVVIYGIIVRQLTGGAWTGDLLVDVATGAGGAEVNFARQKHFVHGAYNGSGQVYDKSVLMFHEGRKVASGTRVAARVQANGDNYDVTVLYTKAA